MPNPASNPRTRSNETFFVGSLEKHGGLKTLVVLSHLLFVSGLQLHAAQQLPPLEWDQDIAFVSTTAEVRLKQVPPDAQIRYSLDGSIPTLNRGQAYQAPLKLGHTTILRVVAFSNGQPATRPSTRTYLSLGDVLHQTANPPGFPQGDNAWQDEPSYYAMDPRVVDAPQYRDQMLPALQALPSLSLVCTPEDLFGPRRGLYLNTQERGPDWERPCSLEWIETNGVRRFTVDCGVRIQGNTGRRPDKTPKHSFRLTFKKDFGAGKLHFQVFPDSPVKAFDTLVLRADYNNAWTHWKPEDNQRAQRIRDAWVKDSHRAMGHLAAHSRFVHLYLNGLYWGIYDLAERPDASFASAYLGGEKEDYDVLDDSGVKNGLPESRRDLVGFSHRQNPLTWETASARIDLPQFIDYLLLNFYIGNQDWGEQQNWYAIRNHTGDRKFRYYAWDGEITLQSLVDDVVNDPDRPPFQLDHRLRADMEYRMAFADRVQKHCFGSGALTPAASIARWQQRAAELNTAILAESARWGYCRRNPPFTRDRDWYAEQRRLVIDYFPRRNQVLLKQLRTAGLYPNVEAPVLSVSTNQNSPKPFEVSLAVKAQQNTRIYYTTDGTDPRLMRKNSTSESAIEYQSPLALAAPSLLRARTLRGTNWSALVEWKTPE